MLAAKRKSEGDLDLSELHSALSLLEEKLKNRVPDASHIDFDFHIELVRLGNNRFLDKMLHSIVKDIERSKKIVTIDFDSAELEIELHKNIYNAINAGDINAAREAMAAHFDNTERYYRNC